MSSQDPVGTALGAIGTAAASGGAVMTAGVAALALVRTRAPNDVSLDAGFLMLSAAVVAGIATAGGLAWRLTHPLEDAWRRGVAAAVSVFAACFLAVLAAPADMLAGRPGILLYLALLVATAARARGYTRRAAAR